MELYLLRHGLAVQRGAASFPNDSYRPLTAEGGKRTRKVARGLAVLKVKFDAVLTSPYVRAKQTADIVVEVLGIPQRLRLCQALAPGGQPRELVEELKRLGRGEGRVLLVGHEPCLSQFASLLISGRGDVDLTLKKAGLCMVETGDLAAGRCASLQLLLTPKMLARMSKG
jgi:phosphohistidine phosphatase